MLRKLPNQISETHLCLLYLKIVFAGWELFIDLAEQSKQSIQHPPTHPSNWSQVWSWTIFMIYVHASWCNLCTTIIYPGFQFVCICNCFCIILHIRGDSLHGTSRVTCQWLVSSTTCWVTKVGCGPRFEHSSCESMPSATYHIQGHGSGLSIHAHHMLLSQVFHHVTHCIKLSPSTQHGGCTPPCFAA